MTMAGRLEKRPRGSVARLPALDGMRGIAASIVLLYHSSLIARPFIDTGRIGDAWWWLSETPLKIFTAGTESVLVFFVLSGLVVALPTLMEGFSWASFLTTRFLRLYLPVWGALVLATVLVFAVPRSTGSVTSEAWIDDGSAKQVTAAQFFSEASLWRASYDIDNVLWSLRWELVFSVLLPVFVASAILVKRWWYLAAPLACALTVAGRILEFDALVYLPVFFLGTLMAVSLPELLAFLEQVPSRLWWIVVFVSIIFMTASWMARPLLPAGTAGSATVWGFAGIGAAGLILVTLGFEPARRLLSSRVPQWLGAISFSLYLVHVPILQTLTFLLGDERWPLVIAFGIPLSLLLGQLFFSGVERPAHRLARLTGRAVGAALSRVRSPAIAATNDS